jgi:hypothetical protein
MGEAVSLRCLRYISARFMISWRTSTMRRTVPRGRPIAVPFIRDILSISIAISRATLLSEAPNSQLDKPHKRIQHLVSLIVLSVFAELGDQVA